MDAIKVLTVFGTRPEAIKMCPLLKVLANDARFSSTLCVTGQHRQLLDPVLRVFQVIPDFDLNIMTSHQTLSTITSSVILELEKVIRQIKPNFVLVHGDTSTSFVAALSAFYCQVPVGHVEAGLRTYNKYSPYPEEINRQMTSRIAELHFCPTQNNSDALKKEGITDNIFVTGNTVIDAFSTTIIYNYTFKEQRLRQLDISKKIVLLTAHRRENWGKPLENICGAVIELCDRYPEIQFVYPVHPNPIVAKPVEGILGFHPNIYLTAPIDVEDMHNLMNKCFLIMTDSGGLQEEAPHLGKPVIVLRTETERPEAVEAGTAVVAGVSKENIVKAFEEIYLDNAVYSRMSAAHNPYGDGKASQRIADAIFSAASQDRS